MALEKKANSSEGSANVTVYDVSEHQGWGPSATKALLRKLDWHILPFMSLIYLVCFIDRTNVANARLDNLEADLKLVNIQYNDCLAILFPFYIASEIPSNIAIKRFRPSIWIAFLCTMWSICMICQGFVKNYAGLMSTRAFVGLFEGGLYPGVNFFITQWYRREECGFRMALFFSAATLAGAFGGILARGIAEMSGTGGYKAWSWIFILEGLFSFLVGVACYFLIVDYPHQAKFINEDERKEVQRRLAEQTGHLDNTLQSKYVFQALKDWKIFVHMGIFFTGFSSVYSIALFLPTIIKGMGYTNNNAQLMSVPPYVCACVATIGGTYMADVAKQRGVFLIGFQLLAITGFAMLIASSQSSVQYGGVVLAAMGVYTQIPLSISWNSGNIGGSVKRGTGIAMQVMAGNCGGILSAYVYIARDGPRYIKGHSIIIGLQTFAFILTLFNTIYLRRENARREKLISGTNPASQELTDEQKSQERELADNALWWRYVY